MAAGFVRLKKKEEKKGDVAGLRPPKEKKLPYFFLKKKVF